MHQQLENLEWEYFCIPVEILAFNGYGPGYPFISHKKPIFQDNTFFLFFDSICEAEFYGKRTEVQKSET